jgi:hypothetical protein
MAVIGDQNSLEPILVKHNPFFMHSASTGRRILYDPPGAWLPSVTF